MWTEITREQYRRGELRYASDTRPGEWAQIAPLLPAPRRLGRPRERDLRTIVDAILYLLWTGCQWRALPREFPPCSTVQGYFYRWRDDGTWHRINALLVAGPGGQPGIDPGPGAVVAPAIEIALHRRARRKFTRQGAPLTPGPQQIEDGVDDRAQVALARPPEPTRGRQQRRNLRPLPRPRVLHSAA